MDFQHSILFSDYPYAIVAAAEYWELSIIFLLASLSIRMSLLGFNKDGGSSTSERPTDHSLLCVSAIIYHRGRTALSYPQDQAHQSGPKWLPNCVGPCKYSCQRKQVSKLTTWRSCFVVKLGLSSMPNLLCLSVFMMPPSWRLLSSGSTKWVSRAVHLSISALANCPWILDLLSLRHPLVLNHGLNQAFDSSSLPHHFHFQTVLQMGWLCHGSQCALVD